jgi:SAM-dependent methyltransferase
MCRNCELFFVDPYPTRVQQHQRVSSSRRAEIEILDCERRYRGERLYYDRHFDWIAEECVNATSILDVGCGTGHLLEKFGASPNLYRAGIELNPQTAQFARHVSGCQIFETPLEGFRAERAFDVLTMVNVFSHIPSFDAMFSSVRAALRPGGKLILRTSEMSPSISRWNQLHWGIPDDLHFLGLRTLDFLCAKYGFMAVRHVRTPFEDELFRASRWQQMGRNRAVNLAKRAGVAFPPCLILARKAYAAMLGKRLFVSFIVLKQNHDGTRGALNA